MAGKGLWREMKTKTADKRGGSWTGALLGDTGQEVGGFLGKEGAINICTSYPGIKGQTAKEVREPEMSAELGTSRSVVESRDKNKDSEVAGGCCFPWRFSLQIRHMY